MGSWLVMFAAVAAGQVQAAQPAVPKPTDVVVTGRSKKVCERSVTLGSIIPTRICKTPEEWEQIRESALILVGKMQDGQMFHDNAQRHRAAE